jgi:hypothetical protein
MAPGQARRVIEQRQLDLLAEGGYLGLANSRRECPKNAPLGSGAKRGLEMWGAVSKPPTCPNFQTRVSQLGRFHWPDLEMACRGSTQLREFARLERPRSLRSARLRHNAARRRKDQARDLDKPATAYGRPGKQRHSLAEFGPNQEQQGNKRDDGEIERPNPPDRSCPTRHKAAVAAGHVTRMTIVQWTRSVPRSLVGNGRLSLVCAPNQTHKLERSLQLGRLLRLAFSLHVVILQQFSNFFPPMRSNAFLKR